MAKGRRAGLRAVILGLAMAAGCCAAHAQQAAYPAKPVSIIIAAAAGNSPDVAARIVADALRGRRLCLPSALSRTAWWLSRLAPALYERQMLRRQGGEFDL